MQIAQSNQLRLRTLRTSDAENMLPYFSDPEVCRFIPWEPRGIEGVNTFLTEVSDQHVPKKDGDDLVLGIEHLNHGVIGQLKMFYRSQLNGMVEVGYVINPVFSGRGFVTQALGLFIDWIFQFLPARRITAQVDQRNLPSSKVLRRLGFRLEATEIDREWFKGEYCTMETYALLKSEWRGAELVNS
ncbi:GNAT family N-acetyltransferase [Candidatus Aquiluna sp. UB-MaderosW2red]|uniref:GNAT family N-acetyltransferase n=1 Tax=Candidatus Aquiluna sp. UB-MaderosW2red TaxID=1855377 RepID=UPI000875B241|nr:GNAT family protein [Candidatus Aquiluna sp. UB-MaderosW2red]SCX13095.1 Protein N-acetyltransferase, RimJ/RimL family [Candidatus Aquiluna sp. UB-MaderosW2red]